MIVGETLVLGYRLGEGVELVTLPLLPSPTDSTTSIYDGPDPTGERQEDEDDDDSQNDATDEITNHDGVNLLPRLEDE